MKINKEVFHPCGDGRNENSKKGSRELGMHHTQRETQCTRHYFEIRMILRDAASERPHRTESFALNVETRDSGVSRRVKLARHVPTTTPTTSQSNAWRRMRATSILRTHSGLIRVTFEQHE